jgi:hypothetical protein
MVPSIPFSTNCCCLVQTPNDIVRCYWWEDALVNKEAEWMWKKEIVINVRYCPGTCPAGKLLWGRGGIPTINTRLQTICTFIGIVWSLRWSSLMFMVSGWLRWPGDCSWSWLTALLLRRLLGMLFFTDARSMGRAVQWSLLKPESKLIRLVPTKVLTDLLLSLVTLQFTGQHANCNVGNIRAIRSEASWQLTDWTDPRRLVNCLETDPSENTARNSTCCDCWLPWKVLFIGLLLGYRFA